MGPFAEDALRPISALQHLVFCERQCALIHLEQVWADNVGTVEGSALHERVDGSERREVRGAVVIIRGLSLRSLRLGLVGRADVVELHRDDTGIGLPGLTGRWRPFPVEYKRGKPKADRCDEVQLCAQALCLEEMLDAEVGEGALFYGRQQRRHHVRLDDRLRQYTVQAALRLHELLDSCRTPAAERSRKCRSCSLESLCMPRLAGRERSARRWLQRARYGKGEGASNADEEGEAEG